MSTASLNAQKVDSAYLVYKQQFADLINTRSGSVSEAVDALDKFNLNQIESNETFAALLKRLYSQHQGIAVVLYFYRADSLKRVFFEPGKVVEEKTIAISKEALFTLGEDLNNGIGLYKAAANRSPMQRGVAPLPGKNNKPVNLDLTIQKLTHLLLPESFDESYKHLVVIPALNIGSLPFHLLRPYKDDSYLIDKCSFTIAPTLVDFVGLRFEMLAELSPRGYDLMSTKSLDELTADGSLYASHALKMNLENALFVSNPAYPTNGKYYFPDLPGAAKEIDSALQYSRRYTLLKGKAAVKDSVLKYLNGADVAYYATHGMSSSIDADDNTFLVLSGSDPYLTSLEIKDLRFKKGFKTADLVILSACQTGLGAPMEAGMMGSLSRAFLLAGSNHVIMSLWNVDDKATAFLMGRFIHHLGQPHAFTPAAPLRLAILETRAKFPELTKWASFSLFGVNY